MGLFNEPKEIYEEAIVDEDNEALTELLSLDFANLF